MHASAFAFLAFLVASSTALPVPLLESVVAGFEAAFVSWEPVKGDDLTYKVVGFSNKTLLASVEKETKNHFVEFTNLQHGVEYSFQVVVSDAQGDQQGSLRSQWISPKSMSASPAAAGRLVSPAAASTSGKRGHGFQVQSVPAFAAQLSGSPQSCAGSTTGTTTTVHFATEYFDISSNYDTSTWTFTAPSAGVYQFGATLCFTPGASTSQVIIYINNPITDGRVWQASNPTSQITQTASTMVQLAASATVKLQLFVLTSSGAASTSVSDVGSVFWGTFLQ